jgi:predicted membrane chloride channel (bestrophin family)
MIEYQKGLFGVPALFYFHGSVLPRCVFPAMLSAAITAAIRWIGYFTEDLQAESMWHASETSDYSAYGQGAFQSLNVMLGFLLVYRTQQGYARQEHEGAGLFFRRCARRRLAPSQYSARRGDSIAL